MISYLSCFLQERMSNIGGLHTQLSELSFVNLEGGQLERPVVIGEGLWIEEGLELLPFLELDCIQCIGAALYIFEQIVLLVLASLEDSNCNDPGPMLVLQRLGGLLRKCILIISEELVEIVTIVSSAFLLYLLWLFGLLLWFGFSSH